jgi:rod shape-determining protein MreC
MPPYITDHEERGPRRQLILTVAVLGLAVGLRILPPAPQQQIAAFFRGTVLFPFVLIQEGLAASRVHAESTEDLQVRLDSLAGEVANQRGLAEENSGLRELLGLGRRVGSRFVAASVIRAGTSMSESSFVLDVGSDQGVREDVTVMTGAGLLGVVSGVGRERANAVDWTHPDFRASAMTSDGTTFGMVRAGRSDFREADRLRLDGVPFQQELTPGTLIVTSGLGGVHPRGIPIGVIESDAESEVGTGWRRSYWVRPAAEPGSATHVLVLVAQDDSLPDLRGLWEPGLDATSDTGGTSRDDGGAQ